MNFLFFVINSLKGNLLRNDNGKSVITAECHCFDNFDADLLHWNLQKTDSFPQYQSEGRYTSDFWKEPIPWRVPNSVTVCNDSLWKLSQPLRHKKRIELKGQSLYDQRTSYNILILVPHILLLHLILIFVEVPSSYVYQHNYHLGLKRVQNIYDMHLLESCF